MRKKERRNDRQAGVRDTPPKEEPHFAQIARRREPEERARPAYPPMYGRYVPID